MTQSPSPSTDADALPAPDAVDTLRANLDAVDTLRANLDAADPLRAGPDAGTYDFVPAEPVMGVDADGSSSRPGRGLMAGLGYLGAALAGALLVGAGLVAFGGAGRAAPPPSPSPTVAATSTPAPIAADGPSLGSAAAPVTVEVWADYQCPFCQLLESAFGGSIERAYVLNGVARIVARDFAFLGQESIDAAVAARCAGSQDPGGYWRYHDLLFASQQGENQGAFKRENLVTLAGVAALDPVGFTACLDDPSVAKAVADETARGGALGITSTPTLRISGPGGTQILTGLGSGWSAIRDAIERISRPAPSSSSAPGGSSIPGESGAPEAPAASP